MKTSVCMVIVFLGGILALFSGCARQVSVFDQFQANPSSGHETQTPPPGRVRAMAAPTTHPPPSRPPERTGSDIPAHRNSEVSPNVILVPLDGTRQTNTPASYTVRRGDSLAALARRFYGDASHWRTIYQANRQIITDPNNLPAGATLQIPPAPRPD